MKLKKLTSLLLTGVLLLTGSQFVFASNDIAVSGDEPNVKTSYEENREVKSDVELERMVSTYTNNSNASANIKKSVDNYVTKTYGEFYTIGKVNTKLVDCVVNGDILSVDVSINFEKTLKAKSVDEIPYVNGMLEQSKALRDPEEIALANQLINKQRAVLQEYIGAVQEQNDTFRAEFNVSDYDDPRSVFNAQDANLFFLNYDTYVPAVDFAPMSSTGMINEGKANLLDSIVSDNDDSRQIQATAVDVGYKRTNAATYANTYTSERSSGSDTGKWNSSYTFYDSDCANYVSQALAYGGIPTTTDWKKDSVEWIRTGYNNNSGVVPYMVGKGYFKSCTKSEACAGSIISYTGSSHVMFVVSNDTVTMLYSAHTTDRLKASFSASTFTSSNYYKPTGV